MRSAQAGGGQEARAIGRMRARRTGSKRTIHYTSLGVRALRWLCNTPPCIRVRFARLAIRHMASMRTVLA